MNYLSLAVATLMLGMPAVALAQSPSPSAMHDSMHSAMAHPSPKPSAGAMHDSMHSAMAHPSPSASHSAMSHDAMGHDAMAPASPKP